MKSITTFLLASLLISTTYTAACTLGCISCFYGTCEFCNQKIVKDGKCSSTAAPQDDNCLIYKDYSCAICKSGFSLKNGNCDKKLEIQNCQQAEFNEKLGHICTVCIGGFPSATGQTCVDFTQAQKDKFNGNCLWGARDFDEMTTDDCWRCKPGFNWSPSKGNCVEAVTPGCMIEYVNFAECDVCDYYEGYYMPYHGQCIKEN